MSEPHAPSELASRHLPAGARLRPLTEADAFAVARIAGALGDSDDPAYWLRKLEVFTRDSASCLGVEADGRLVAYMLGNVKGGEFGLADETAFLEFLGVDPTWQGQGLARSLAEALCEQFAAKGVRHVLTLVSGREERLLPFFRSLGFRTSQLLCLERRL